MIKLMQKHTKIILWILITTFVIWGVGVGVSSLWSPEGKASYAGKVFGKKISFDYFNQIRQEVFIESYLSGQNQQAIEKMDLNRETWLRILLLEEAKRKKIEVSDQDVAEMIYGSPAFRRGDVFEKDRYLYFLKNILKLSPAQFENCIRNSMKVIKLKIEALNTFNPSEEELKKRFIEEKEKAKVLYVCFPLNENNPAFQPKREDLIQYFDTHKEVFRIPDQVKMEYLFIPFDTARFMESITPQAIQEYYVQHQDEFTVANEDGTSRTISVDEASASIREKLAKIQAQTHADVVTTKAQNLLIQNTDFKKVADELHIKTQETGFFSEKDIIPEIGYAPVVGEKAFRIKPMELAGPLTESAGNYIIRVLEKRTSYIPSLVTAQTEVRRHYIRAKAKEEAKKKASELLITLQQKLAEIKGEPEGTTGQPKHLLVQSVVQQAGFTAKTSEYVTRDDHVNEIGYVRELFSLQPESLYQEVVNTPDGYALLYLIDRTPPSQEEITKGFDSFKKDYLNRERFLRMLQWMMDLEKRAQLEKNT